MTPTETNAAMTAIQGLFPNAKRTPAEWSVVAEGLARMPLEVAQVVAAARHLKATSVKYPSVASILTAVRAAVPVTRAGCSPRVKGEPSPRDPEQVIAEHMAHRDKAAKVYGYVPRYPHMADALDDLRRWVCETDDHAAVLMADLYGDEGAGFVAERMATRPHVREMRARLAKGKKLSDIARSIGSRVRPVRVDRNERIEEVEAFV